MSAANVDELGGSAAAVIDALVRRGESLAVVESLTGGLLAATLVSVPGASRAFRGGLVVYASDLKSSLGGVPAGLLARRGPVDPDVALALARGGRRRCGADWCLATTGVAGPDPQDGQPIGLVFVGLAGPACTLVRRLDVDGGRQAVRVGAVAAALRLLIDELRRPLPAEPGGPADV